MISKVTLQRALWGLLGILFNWLVTWWWTGFLLTPATLVFLSVLTLVIGLVLLRHLDQPSATDWKRTATCVFWVLLGGVLVILLLLQLNSLISYGKFAPGGWLGKSVCAVVALELLVYFYIWRWLLRHNRAFFDLCEKGGEAVERLQYQEAEPFFRSALNEAGRAWFRRREFLERSLYNLAFVYLQQKKAAEAEPLLRELLVQLDNRKDASQVLLLDAVVLLAGSHLFQKDHNAAFPLLKRARALWRQTVSSRSLRFAEMFFLLGREYSDRGNFLEASRLYAEAVAIFEDYGDQGRVARTLTALGSAELDLSRYEEALQVYERALQIFESLFGADHINTATALSNLGVAYSSQGALDLAEAHYRRAVAIREAKLGTEHPDTANTLNNLAHLLCRQGRYEEAEEVLQRAIQIWKSTADRRLPYGLGTLARLRDGQNRVEEAEALYQRSCQGLEALLGPAHPQIAETLEEHAALLARVARTGEAELLQARAARIRQAVQDEQRPEG